MRSRRRGSRGAAMVEAALVTPVFLALLFGVLEMGYAFMDRLTVKNSSLAGARVGSSEGTNLNADYNIVQAVKRASGGLSGNQVKKIIVYKAASYTASVPPQCLTASQANLCNRYTGATLSLAPTQFGCGGAVDTPWCPNLRKTAQTGTFGPPDYLGVYIEARHDNLTGFFGSGYDFKSDTVIRLEPQKLA